MLTSPQQVAVAIDKRCMGRAIGKGGKAIKALRSKLRGAGFDVAHCFADELSMHEAVGAIKGRGAAISRLVAVGPGLAEHKHLVQALLLAHGAKAAAWRPTPNDPNRRHQGDGGGGDFLDSSAFAKEEERDRRGAKMTRDKRKGDRRRRRSALGGAGAGASHLGGRCSTSCARRSSSGAAVGCGAAGWSGRGWRSNALEVDFVCY